jgi:hypothetical protein
VKFSAEKKAFPFNLLLVTSHRLHGKWHGLLEGMADTIGEATSARQELPH